MRVRRALREGVRLMHQDPENFAHMYFYEWHVTHAKALKPDRLAAMYDPDEQSQAKQYLTLGVLGYQYDEKYWSLFRLAYAEGDNLIRDMAEWAMCLVNAKRFGYETGLDNFFDALARYAEMVFNEAGGQLSLF